MVKFKPRKDRYIRSIKTLKEFVSQKGSLANCTVQDIDFKDNYINWSQLQISHTTFLGCELKPEDACILLAKGAFLYPRLPDLPYNPYRNHLYSCLELMDGYSHENDLSLDYSIYRHFTESRYNPDINEALSQRVHDHAIDEALRGFLEFDEAGLSKKKCIGIMGGHGTLRTDEFHIKVAKTAKMLADAGYFVASGGGPGIMDLFACTDEPEEVLGFLTGHPPRRVDNGV
jgi:hypothetical protein